MAEAEKRNSRESRDAMGESCTEEDRSLMGEDSDQGILQQTGHISVLLGW